MRFLFLLFVTIPILEMWVLIEVGAMIGALRTILLVFLTAAIGLVLLRQQGFSTLLRVNEKVAHGELPATEILEGVALAVGGALLLTPGFITDAFGFACLIPFTRRWMISGLLKRGLFVASGSSGFSAHHHHSSSRGSDELGANRDHSSSTIDGEYRRED